MSSMSVTIPRFCRTRSATEFERALRADDIAKVTESIQKDAFQPNNQLKSGTFPLHLAVHHPCPVAVVEELIKKGADPLKEDTFGLTAIDHALLANNQEKLMKLLGSLGYGDELVTTLKKEQIAQANESLKKAYDFLEVTDPKAMEMCKKANKKWEVDCYGMTPLHYAIVAPTERVEIATFLVQTDDFDKITIAGLSPLHLALFKKNKAAFTTLVERNDLLRDITKTKLNALHIAFLQNDFEAAKILLKKAPNLLTQPDANGLTPRDIFLATLYSQKASLYQKTGVVQNAELFLLTLQIAVPLLWLGCTYFELERCLSVLPYLSTMQYGVESKLLLPSPVFLISVALQSYYGAAGKVATALNIVRTACVAHQTIKQIQQSQSFSAFYPYSTVRDSIVHLATGSISLGRSLMRLLYSS